MSVTVVTAATTTPVTVDELKSHLRISSTDEDTLLSAYLNAALGYLLGNRGILNRAAWPETYEWRRRDFDNIMRLPIGPVKSIDSVIYLNSAGTTTAASSANYVGVTAAEPGRVELADGYTWPSVASHPEAVRITFTAGSTAPPDDLKHLVKLLVGHWYENREPVIVGTISNPLPFAVDALIAKLKIHVPESSK